MHNAPSADQFHTIVRTAVKATDSKIFEESEIKGAPTKDLTK
jgi:hypothetical protein